MTRVLIRMVLAAAVVCSTAVVSMAQQTSTATETKTFEVLAVDGNKLDVQLPEGTRELTVPNDFRFTVNGQQLSVQQLKVGMKGTATITTRTTVTPVTVTEVKNGEVVVANGGVIMVRTDEGVRSFTQGDVDKRAVKIMKNGKAARVVDFHAGDRLTATIITSKPPTVLTEREVQATLAAAPAPAAAGGARPAAGAPANTLASSSPAPGSASAAAPGGRTLPKTASSWPALGLLSVLSLVMGLALTVRRRFVG